MRGLILLTRRSVCRQTALNLKKTCQEPLWFSSTTARNNALATPSWKSKSTRKLPGNLSKIIPNGPCRTRFAPSPTGYLHLGSLRTALFNYLLAKATGGQFILRIEDTDRTRLVPDAEKRLYDDLHWAGLTWDEGPNLSDGGGPYGPYRQSERLSLYDEHADQLIREGKAYRCFCSPEDLEHQKHAAHASGEPTHYPGTCRSISAQESDARAANGESFAVRFKSGEKPVVIHDMVYGRYTKNEREEDFIIRKRDGFPTYHFANVVDDRLMEITHVIRGAEWLISTPKHVEMYTAFGWEPPAFGHVGLLVDMNRRKLSKRDSGVDMSWYKDKHVLPRSLLNFAVLLGWGRPASVKSDVMTLEQMVDSFAPKFSKGDIVVDLGKLAHLQTKHIRRIVEQKEITDPRTLSELEVITQPILDTIKHIEETRRTTTQETLSAPEEERKNQPEEDTIISNTAKRVGRPLPITELLFPDNNNMSEQQQQKQNNQILTRYAKDVLEANNKIPDPGPLTAFASENWFLFFTIPKKSLHDEESSYRIILDKYIQNDPANATVAIVHLENLHAAISSVVDFLPENNKNYHEHHPSGDFSTKSKIEQAINHCIPSKKVDVGSTSTSKKIEQNKNGGNKKPVDPDVKFFWALARWALTTVDVGPALVKIVQMIGKEESLRRLDQARRVMVGVKEEICQRYGGEVEEIRVMDKEKTS